VALTLLRYRAMDVARAARVSTRSRLRTWRGLATVGVPVRRVITILLLLAVFLPSMALARAQHLCGNHLVRKACCCPPKRVKHDPGPQVPTMQRECCSIEQGAPITPPVAEQVSAQGTPAPIAIVVRTSAVPVALQLTAHAVVPRAQAPPRRATRSLFSQRCALLV